MRGKTRTVLVALAVAGMAATAVPAFAADEPQLTMVSTVRWGGGTSVHVGPCTTVGDVTSPGFTAPVVISASGDGWAHVVKAEGTYTASVQCDDATLTTTFTVLPPAAPEWVFGPEKVEPSGQMYVGTDQITRCPGGPDGPVTSPGLYEPITLLPAQHGRLYGYGVASSVPGTYTATLRCKETPVPGEITFTVLGTPPTTPPSPPVTTPPGTQPSTQPPAAAPARNPIVKPKGAPQTGGGATS